MSCCVGGDIRATCQCAAHYEWWDDRRLSAVDEPRRLGHCCDHGAYCSCMESELGAGCTAPDCGRRATGTRTRTTTTTGCGDGRSRYRARCTDGGYGRRLLRGPRRLGRKPATCANGYSPAPANPTKTTAATCCPPVTGSAAHPTTRAAARDATRSVISTTSWTRTPPTTAARMRTIVAITVMQGRFDYCGYRFHRPGIPRYRRPHLRRHHVRSGAGQHRRLRRRRRRSLRRGRVRTDCGKSRGSAGLAEGIVVTQPPCPSRPRTRLKRSRARFRAARQQTSTPQSAMLADVIAGPTTISTASRRPTWVRPRLVKG